MVYSDFSEPSRKIDSRCDVYRSGRWRLVPTRQFEVFDMAANAAGVVMAWLLASTFLGTILIWFERVALPPRAGSV